MSFAWRDRLSTGRGIGAGQQHRTSPVPSIDGPMDAGQLIALQRLAGNRATSDLLAVQRCGPIPSGECPCHDGAEADGQERAEAGHSAESPVAGWLRRAQMSAGNQAAPLLIQRACACEDETRSQALTGMGVPAEEEAREQPVMQRSTTWNGASVHATLSPAETALGTGGSPVTWEVLNGSVVKSGAAAAAAIKEPTVTTSGSGSTFTAKVDAVPAQTAGADETVLRPGPWTKTITKAQAGAVTGLPACTGAGSSTFSVKGSPSDKAVFEANRRHEDHHVSDHKANFQAIIGAWDTKVQDAKDKGTEYPGASGQAARAALWAAAGGTAGAVATTWFDEDGKSGDAFHATPAGGPMSLSNPQAGAGCADCSLDVTNPS